MRLDFSLVAVAVLSLSTVVQLSAQETRPSEADARIERRIDALVERMTLEEKLGQMSQGGWAPDFDLKEAESGIIGSLTNADDPVVIGRIQAAARKSRLGIPILMTHNVIHGFRTLFPVPIAMAASFDPALVRETARWAGRESAAVGLHWTLAPMVDISRDPRWGRVVEGAGEDVFLGSMMAAAQVAGLREGGIIASLKHYVGYGAAEAGRDYNSTSIPRVELRDTYLPPFHAGIAAGGATIMAAFNALNGTPATANRWTLDQVLKREWGFDGFVISDWDSIIELMKHGVAGSRAEAAEKALMAGVDVDMAGELFRDELPALVKAGRVPMARIDDAVRRVLRVKFRLGLFDRPDPDPAAADTQLLTPAAREAARRAARETIVLLRNDGDLLPLAPKAKRIALVGGAAADPSDHMGSWGAAARQGDTVTTLAALQTRASAGGYTLTYARGCADDCTSTEGFDEAVQRAGEADLVIAVLGEPWYMTAEGTSRTRLGLPNRQQELLERLVATGKPVVLVVFAGRPMALTWAAEHVPAILYAWAPGTEGGNGIADLLFGDASPSARLPMTMPRAVGQIPVYYDHLPTGRPATDDRYSSRYIDEENAPLYPFGYGLSYTRFTYADVAVTAPKPDRQGVLEVAVTVANTGARAGKEVVQLYVRDLVASRSRPVRQLKAFDKVALAPGESRRVTLRVPIDRLGFHDEEGGYRVEPGRFEVYLGGDSRAPLVGGFELPTGMDYLGAAPVTLD